MAIAFADIMGRISDMRPDLPERLWLSGFQIAAKRLARLSLALRETVTFNVAANGTSARVYEAAALKDVVWIFKAETVVGGVTTPIPEMNLSDYYAQMQGTKHTAGPISAFANDQGLFLPYLTPTAQTVINAFVAYTPKGDFITADFGADAMDALVCGALAHVLAVPGKGQNQGLALMNENEFRDNATNLEAKVLLGEGGSTRFNTRQTWGRIRQ